jgi:3',5'-cyclic AMP phosphodiesterase CpdA
MGANLEPVPDGKPNEYRLRILHLSDLHERVALEWMDEKRKAKVRLSEAERRRVLEESNFLEIIADDIGTVDLVCFTGDAADWGLPEEFNKATRRLDTILSALKLGRDRLFVVPGNHDVQRKKAELTWNRMRELASRGEMSNRLSGWMAAATDAPFGAQEVWREEIAQRAKAFWDWVDSGLNRGCLLPGNSTHRRLGYCHRVGGLNLPFEVHVLGFDSAWLCGDDNDSGKLRLTPGQVCLQTQDQSGNKLVGFRLALVHHPLSDLADGKQCFRLLAGGADLLLHGHQHDPIIEVTTDPDRKLTVLATGSLYADEGDRWINCFHVIDAFLDERGQPLRYRVTFWGWSERGHWHHTGAIYEKAKEGILEFPAQSYLRAVETLPVGGAEEQVPRELQHWYYIQRPVETERIRTLLLQPKRRAPIAIFGMPGAGKSSLAAELAKDTLVRARYPDVLWATLGAEDPQIEVHFRRFLLAVGSPQLQLSDIETGKRLLSSLLKEKACLLVLDDVWRREDVKPFLESLGPECALLFTTRDLSIAESVDASYVALPPMQPSETRSLIEQLLERSLSEEEGVFADRIAQAVGYLPLAVRLACARVREGDSLERVTAMLKDEQTRLVALEPPGRDDSEERRKNRSLVASFDLSIRRLQGRQQEDFSLLSLLAEDVPFGPPVAASLWSASPDEAECLLRLFFHKGLVLASGSSETCRLFRLHDEQRNAGRRLLSRPTAELHGMLLDLYRTRLSPQGWVSLGDDGYIHDHLIWHLIHAGRISEMRVLLEEEHDTRNAWSVVRERRISGYLRDLDCAAASEGTTPAQEARYAMMQSSVVSLGVNMPFGVVRELVTRRLWTDERALSWALSLAPPNRFESLADLVRILAVPWRDRALDRALDELRQTPEEGEWSKLRMFLRLPVDIPESSLSKVLRAAKGVKRPRSEAVIMALRHFAFHGRFMEVHRELETLPADYDKGVLVRLLLLLPAQEMRWLCSVGSDSKEFARWLPVRMAQIGEPDQALDLVKDLPESTQAWALGKMAAELDVDHLRQAETLVRTMSDFGTRFSGLAAILAMFPEPERTRRLSTLWRDICRYGLSEVRSAREAIIGRLPGPVLKQILNDRSFPSQGIHGDDEKLAAAKRLAELGCADDAARLLDGFGSSPKAMEEVAPRLLEKHLKQLGVADPNHNVIALRYMLPRWAELGHGSEAVDALPRLRTFMDLRNQAAAAMAPHLDLAQLASLQAECNRNDDLPARLRLLAELAALAPQDFAPFLFDPGFECAVLKTSIHRLASALDRGTALLLRASFKDPVARLAVSSALQAAPDDVLIEDLQAAYESCAQQIRDASGKPLSESKPVMEVAQSAVEFFAHALRNAPESCRDKVLEIGRDALGAFSSPLDSPEEFATFWPLEQLVRETLEYNFEDFEITNLAHVAAVVPAADASRVEDIVLKLKPAKWERELEFLESLTAASVLTPRLLQVALDAARVVAKREGFLAWSGPRLAAHLARADRVTEALEITRLTEKYDTHHLNAVVGLAEHLPPPHYAEFLRKAWVWTTTPVYYHRNWNDVDKLKRLSPRASQQPSPTLEEFWRLAIRFVSGQTRPDSWDYLAALAPMIHALTGPKGALGTWKAMLEVSRWWP